MPLTQALFDWAGNDYKYDHVDMAFISGYRAAINDAAATVKGAEMLGKHSITAIYRLDDFDEPIGN